MNNSISSKISDYHSLELQSHVSIDDAIAKVSEELYELEHAIYANDINEIKKEAQDVLINILSISARYFDIGSVLEGVLIKENVHIGEVVALWTRQTSTLRGRFSRGSVTLDEYKKTFSLVISALLHLIDDENIESIISQSIEKFSSRVNDYLPDIHLKDFISEYPDFPKPGILFRDISPLLANPEAMRYASFEFAKNCQSADVIAGLDARGFLFGTLVAQILEKPFVMIRKTGKLPGKTIDEKYDLEYGSNSISIQEGAILPGQKVALIDDLLATGGTMQAAAHLVEKMGAHVDAILCLISLDESFLQSQPARKSIEEKYPVKSILHYN